jgi:hypothetical protein
MATPIEKGGVARPRGGIGSHPLFRHRHPMRSSLSSEAQAAAGAVLASGFVDTTEGQLTPLGREVPVTRYEVVVGKMRFPPAILGVFVNVTAAYQDVTRALHARFQAAGSQQISSGTRRQRPKLAGSLVDGARPGAH